MGKRKGRVGWVGWWMGKGKWRVGWVGWRMGMGKDRECELVGGWVREKGEWAGLVGG